MGWRKNEEETRASEDGQYKRSQRQAMMCSVLGLEEVQAPALRRG
jgi:hypothetical protein